jgi:hypothetical protein
MISKSTVSGLKGLEVDVLEDDAIFDLRPEGPDMLTTSPQGDRLDTPGVCQTIFDHGP